jgi:DNA-binding transcriptional MocR family regulator
MISELLIGPQPAKVEFAKKSKKDQLSFSGWETAGWVRWIEGLRGVYERRMNRMCSALENGRFLVKQSTPVKAADADWAVISKTKMYSFDWPRGGMFLWLQIHYENHPLAGEIAGARLATLLWILLTRPPYLVLVSPGETFCPTDEIRNEKGWQFYRLCFAAVDEDEVAKSSKRLAEGVKAFWLIKDKKEMEEIGKDLDDESIDAEVADLSINFAC